MRSVNCRKATRVLDAVAVSEGASPTLNVMICCVLNPGFTCHKFRIVRNSRLAPVNNINVSATWPTINTCCERCRPPAAPRPPALSASCKSVFELFNAGASPNKIPTVIETPKVNRRTGTLTPIVSARDRFPARTASAGPTPNDANATPSAPPSSESKTLSATNCEAINERLAPSAARIANSRERASDRAIRRLATSHKRSARPIQPHLTGAAAFHSRPQRWPA